MPRIAAILGVIVLALAGPLRAEPYPSPVEAHINDFADLIDGDAETRTRSALATLRTETGIEMTLVTIRSREDFDPSPSLEAFARRLFDGWGIGDAARNDGILLLVVRDDRETRIELGAAYDQGYDVTAQDIVSNWMVPAFREDRYAAGIEDGALESIDRIALTLASEMPRAPLPNPTPSLFERFDGWLFGAIFVGIVVYGILGRRIGDALVRVRRCPGCGRRKLHRHREMILEDDGAGPPKPHVTVACRNCDYRDERELRPKARRESENRRDDFGGGRSSGGGASGRW